MCFLNSESWACTKAVGAEGAVAPLLPMRLNGTPPPTPSNKSLFNYLTLSQYFYVHVPPPRPPPSNWCPPPPPPPSIPPLEKLGAPMGVHLHLLVYEGYVCDGEYNTVQDNINSPVCLITWWPCCPNSY